MLVSLALLLFFLFLLTSATGLTAFEKKLSARSYFNNSQGLKVGAPVNLEGVPVGEVQAVRLSTDPARKLTPVEITMKLSPHFQNRLHTDTLASLSTTGVIGDTVVELNSETATGPELQNGDELRTYEEPSLATFMKSGQGTLNQLNGTIAKLDKVVDGLQNGEGTVGQLLKNPELYNQANATLIQLHTLSANLNRGRGSVGKLLTDDSLYNRLNDAAGRLDPLTPNLSSGKGTAGKLRATWIRGTKKLQFDESGRFGLLALEVRHRIRDHTRFPLRVLCQDMQRQFNMPDQQSAVCSEKSLAGSILSWLGLASVH